MADPRLQQGDKELVGHVAEAMAPLAIFRNAGVVEAFAGPAQGFVA